MATELSPLIVIVGPTASGKSALSMDIAQKYSGEIICADSRTIYKGMDIGTAKPTHYDQELVSHHCLDIVGPDTSFSAARFKQLATDAINDVSSRGKMPIMVGGTGLYVDAVIFDYQFLPLADPIERARLNEMNVEQLQTEIISRGLDMPTNSSNPRHLVRTIEANGMRPNKSDLRSNTLVLGLNPGLNILKTRIEKRIEIMIDMGFIEEIERLSERFGWDSPGLLAPGYKAFREYIENKISLDDAKQQFFRNDYLLARRQITWFKRNKSIQWLDDPIKSVDILTTYLNKKQ